MTDAARIASDLATAERERKQRSPFTDEHPDLDLGVAYDAQWSGVQAKLDAGQRLVGAKVGLASSAGQPGQPGTEPLYGWVTDGMLLAPGEPVALDRFIQPRAEPEIAFLLGRDLGTPATVTSVLAATEAVLAAVDVLDSRYEDGRSTLPDAVADNAGAGAFLLGPAAARPADLVDLPLVGCVLRVDGEVVATAAGAAAMGHPAAAVAWLANRVATRGQVLPAGMLVFSGGLTPPVPVSAGSCVTAELDGLGVVELWAR